MSLVKRKVCIIGAGAAGLAAIRHVNASDSLTGILYESSSEIGGIWNYTDHVGTDEDGRLIHSVMYKGLR
jgi:cation diffusion facilitator CzcD-associated flavoprotein CzcO